MNALFIILLAFFPSAITSPIPDGTINPDIVDPTDFASSDVALANFASKEDPLVNAIDEDSTSTESTLTDPESVASNPNCDTGGQSQGYLQPTEELSTRTSSATPAILAAAVQRGSCPNPAQGSGNSADVPGASLEATPTERDRQYGEHSERKRKSCCQLEPRETITIAGQSVPLVNYGVCRKCMFKPFAH